MEKWLELSSNVRVILIAFVLAIFATESFSLVPKDSEVIANRSANWIVGDSKAILTLAIPYLANAKTNEKLRMLRLRRLTNAALSEEDVTNDPNARSAWKLVRRDFREGVQNGTCVTVLETPPTDMAFSPWFSFAHPVACENSWCLPFSAIDVQRTRAPYTAIEYSRKQFFSQFDATTRLSMTLGLMSRQRTVVAKILLGAIQASIAGRNLVREIARVRDRLRTDLLKVKNLANAGLISEYERHAHISQILYPEMSSSLIALADKSLSDSKLAYMTYNRRYALVPREVYIRMVLFHSVRLVVIENIYRSADIAPSGLRFPLILKAQLEQSKAVLAIYRRFDEALNLTSIQEDDPFVSSTLMKNNQGSSNYDHPKAGIFPAGAINISSLNSISGLPPEILNSQTRSVICQKVSRMPCYQLW